jgi:hypothetical protein
MNEKKYILAHIKIPMEIKEDGSFETLPDYLTILFESLKELPDPADNDYNNEYIKQQIKTLLNNSVQDKEPKPESIEKTLILSPMDVNNRKLKTHTKNITFKNKLHSISRFTAKNYSSIFQNTKEEDKDVD